MRGTTMTGTSGGFKDPMTMLTWRITEQQLPAARWCGVYRPSDEVVASGLRASFMKHRSSERALWTQFVDTYLLHLVGELGLAWRPDAVHAFVAPKHWHAGESRGE